MVLSCAMEPLRDVKVRGGRRRANWAVSTWDGKTVRSSSGLQIMPDKKFDPSRPAKRLVLVAGYGVRDISFPRLNQALRATARQCEALVALDAAPWLLAAAGLLDGQNATIHWQEADELTDKFPNVRVSRERFVKSGKIYTCGGASTVLDLMFEILSNMFGPATAFDASNMFIYSQDKASTSAVEVPGFIEHGSQIILSALELISTTLADPMPINRIAKDLGISPRTLHRVFLKELQTTPGKYIAQFRLKQAKYLADSTRLPVEKIALRCGYSSGPSLCRAYKTAFEETLRRN